MSAEPRPALSEQSAECNIPLEELVAGGVAGRDDVSGELRAALARLVAGEIGALERIYDACASDLFGLAFWRTGSRDDAADAVQEVFVTLASAPPSLGRIRKPRAYLLAMVHSAAIRIIRRRRVTVEIEDSVVDPVISDPAATVDAARVTAIVHSLPPQQSEAVFLRHFAELTFAEIGEVTGVPTFTAASRYRLGIRRLRKLVGVEP